MNHLIVIESMMPSAQLADLVHHSNAGWHSRLWASPSARDEAHTVRDEGGAYQRDIDKNPSRRGPRPRVSRDAEAFSMSSSRAPSTTDGCGASLAVVKVFVCKPLYHRWKFCRARRKKENSSFICARREAVKVF